MTRSRSSLFDKDPEPMELDDLSGFTTKPKSDAGERATTRQVARKVAESAGFESRDPHTQASPGKRRPGRSTGRSAQINMRATPETIAALDAIAEDREWTKAMTFERAVAALQRLLEQGVDPKELVVK